MLAGTGAKGMIHEESTSKANLAIGEIVTFTRRRLFNLCVHGSARITSYHFDER